MHIEPNPRVVLGGNNPPDDTFDAIKSLIEGLHAKAVSLSAVPVVNQGQADIIADLIRTVQQAKSKADDQRKAEAKPFDAAKKAIQEKYAPLIAETKAITGKAPLAIEICTKALKPWLLKVARENEEAAEKARQEAEEKRLQAEAAARAASWGNPDDRITAVKLEQEAKQATTAARLAESSKAHAGSIGRAVHIRTEHRAEVIDPSAFAQFVWESYFHEVQAFLATQAQKLVDQGVMNLPGVVVHDVKGVA